MLAKTSLAQDIEQSVKEAKNLAKQSPLALTGSIGANTVFYHANGITPRRDPFYWTLNANLNFTLFNKVSVPFTALFTQREQKYTNGLDKFSQPFNQFGISPSYKGITVHAGYRSVEFSEYTLSGALFLGGGIEIKPQASLLSGAAVYGRFVKAMPANSTEGISISVPAYERMGGGAKIKLGNEQHYGEIIFLKIKDDVNSIPFDTALTSNPQENQIIALVTKQKVGEVVNVGIDFSYSALTKNLYEKSYKLESFNYVNQIYAPRPSSTFNKAINAVLEFTPSNYKFGLKYKRIDPDYKSLGAIFLTNDVEEVSINASSTFLKNTLNVNVSSGLQHNNLDKNQVLTSRRFIVALSTAYTLNQHTNLNLNYSNFSSNTMQVKDVFTDSIQFIQLTQNGSFAFNYSFGGSKLKHNFSSSSSYMEAGGNKQALTTYLNETLSYAMLMNEFKVGLTLSFIYNKGTNEGQGVNEGYGPNIGISKTLLKEKIKLMLSAGFQNTLINDDMVNKNNIYNFSFNYTLDKHQSFKLNCSYLEKQAVVLNAQQFSEFRGSLAYVYNFGMKTKKMNS